MKSNCNSSEVNVGLQTKRIPDLGTLFASPAPKYYCFAYSVTHRTIRLKNLSVRSIPYTSHHKFLQQATTPLTVTVPTWSLKERFNDPFCLHVIPNSHLVKMLFNFFFPTLFIYKIIEVKVHLNFLLCQYPIEKVAALFIIGLLYLLSQLYLVTSKKQIYC